MTYITRPIKWIVLPEGEPVFCEQATTIEITDEAGGEFVTVSQQRDEPNAQTIKIDRDDWPLIRDAVDAAIKLCKDYE